VTIKIIAIVLLVGAVAFNSDASGSGKEVRLDMCVSLQKEPYGKYLVHVKLTIDWQRKYLTI
jgi:hypothetical protein